jgi:outer membrane protein TolC
MAGWRRRLGWAALAAAVAGCTVGPDYKRPAPAAQSGFADQALGRAGDGDVQQSAAAAADIRADWWTLLASPALDAVERQALADNWTLAARQAAIARARQALAVVHGEDYPALAAQGQAGQTRIGATVFGPDAYSFPIFSAYGTGLSGAYDPDLFGGRRRRVEAAGAA